MPTQLGLLRSSGKINKRESGSFLFKYFEMKIHYYSPKSDPTIDARFRNFGDDLNATLWDELFPGLLDENETTIFSGIGSHLNEGFAKRFASHNHVIFGTGWGYGAPVQSLGTRWKPYFVRGPLTAEALGLEPSAAITDAAVLIRLVYRCAKPRDIPIAFMPHVASMEAAGSTWEIMCQELDYHLIDVRKPVQDVLVDLERTQLLLTEALHGAIVADALRTPWLPFVSNQTISSLKWRDWCASIDADYLPVQLPTLWKNSGKASLFGDMKMNVKLKLLKSAMRRMPTVSKPFLSSDITIQSLTDRLAAKAEALRVDYRVRNSEKPVPPIVY